MPQIAILRARLSAKFQLNVENCLITGLIPLTTAELERIINRFQFSVQLQRHISEGAWQNLRGGLNITKQVADEVQGKQKVALKFQ